MTQLLMSVAGLVVVALIVSVFTRRGAAGSGPALVLREFKIDDFPAAGAPLVHIRGRVPGLFGWLFTTLGVDAETDFIVTPERVRVRKASLSGHAIQEATLSSIASTQSSYHQPIWALVVAGLFTIFGVLGALVADNDRASILFGSLIWAAIFAAIYYLGRKIVIAAETAGGSFISVSFKPSFIEGVTANETTAMRAIDVINTHIVRSKVARAIA